MGILKGVIIAALTVWILYATAATLSMNVEYKWAAWSIVAMGPVVIVAGLWEVCSRVSGKR